MTDLIQRTTPWTFESMTYTELSLGDLLNWVSNQPDGDNTFQYDQNTGDPQVAIGRDPIYGNPIYQTLQIGDTITRIFSRWWTIIPASEFDNDYELVS